MHEAFLKYFEADADALVRRLCSLITDDQLAAIAEADYGMDRAEHLVELQAIKAAGRVTTVGPWHPHEVLSLIGHSQPDMSYGEPGNTGIDGWMKKAFCTAVLTTITAKDNGIGSDEIPYHLGGLTVSILRLQTLGACDLRPELTQFAAWAMSRDLTVEDRPFVGLALLTGALARRPPIDDSTVVAICEWISAAECRLAAQARPGGSRWLVGHSTSFQPAETWSPVGVHLCESPLDQRGEAARTWMRTLGSALATG